MGTTLPILAGIVSTTVFACSMLPMLAKAARTHDLTSYSLGHLLLANVGNAVHSVYVFHLPPGPIWFLHGFYLVTSALMLFWWVRHRPPVGRGGPRCASNHCHSCRTGTGTHAWSCDPTYVAWAAVDIGRAPATRTSTPRRGPGLACTIPASGVTPRQCAPKGFEPLTF
jgi:hypothetical protein